MVRVNEADIQAVWERVTSLAGFEFRQSRGKRFSYEVVGTTVRVDTVNQNIPRSQFVKALQRDNVRGPGDLNDLRAPSYIFGILDDPRVAGLETGIGWRDSNRSSDVTYDGDWGIAKTFWRTMPSEVQWQTPIGAVLPRREVHDLYGGSRQSGITSAQRVGSVLLFSSQSGHQYGHMFDGWQQDGFFHYTGEGQSGDQVLTRGNKAVDRNYGPLRLFVSKTGGMVEYLGPFRAESAFRTDAPDRTGDTRSVIVFRLAPLADGMAPAAGAEDLELSDNEPTGPQVTQIPIELNNVDRFPRKLEGESVDAERREAQLVDRYKTYLLSVGHEVTRDQIRFPGAFAPMYTDLHDLTTSELIEAKSSSARFAVRLGLGQILDYGRFVQTSHRALLLPTDPGRDLAELLASHGVGCIFEQPDGSFARVDTETLE